METPDLYDLIKSLNYGSKYHIGVVFLENNRNRKCALPHEHTIHSSSICNLFKGIPGELARCIQCRNRNIKKAEKEKKPFWEYCINGVYEYTAPVVLSGKTVAVIFVGNILTSEGKEVLQTKMKVSDDILNSMEETISEQRAETISRIIASYISMLLEKFPNEKNTVKSIIENVKGYILANLKYELKLSEVAELFFYNEVYLGRLFKNEVGESFNDYVNRQRINLASQLLHTELSVTQISGQVGYNNVSYFNRVFKTLVGVTPTEYRNSLV